jgi:hypothetical protein
LIGRAGKTPSLVFPHYGLDAAGFQKVGEGLVTADKKVCERSNAGGQRLSEVVQAHPVGFSEGLSARRFLWFRSFTHHCAHQAVPGRMLSLELGCSPAVQIAESERDSR